ncbi:MAG: hypothetical protein ACRCY8_19465 [Dermatophilaceae bacterium]
MSQEAIVQYLPSTAVAARRAVLGAGVAAGFVVGGASPSRAAPAAKALEILPPETTAWVATGSHGRVRLPGVLGTRLRTGSAALPSGTTVRLTWDHRVYERTVPALTGEDGRKVPLRLLGRPTTDRATGVVAATVRTGAELPAGRDFILTVGTRRPLRYPDDVVVEPAPVTVTVGDPRRGPRRSLAAEPAAATLWGAVVGAGWQLFAWGDGLHAWVPSLITVRSVGPGYVPAGTTIEAVLDARIAGDVRAVAADGTRLARGRRAGDRLGLRWTFKEPLTVGARRSARLEMRTTVPSGGLSGFQAPTVSLAPPRGDVGQRTTGAESVSRTDNAVDVDSRARFGFGALATG